jgi:hypothetical protein
MHVIIFTENTTVNGAVIKYQDVSGGWPYTIEKSYATVIPKTVEFDVQRTGRFIQFEVALSMNGSLSICEIDVDGKTFKSDFVQSHVVLVYR